MNYDEIKKLMDDMGNSKLSEIEIEFPDGIKISMKKDDGLKLSSPVPMVQEVNIPAVKENADLVPVEKVEGNVVKAPMVGTFYSKSSPTSEPFVKVGSKVKKGDTLCIIEAMKLMNEIESEFDGEVVEILVKDEEMVEYGKPLFVIK
ncbi:MAG: acetyl-CoA carboxylase biotin carboxyl carrier protein [Clostridia bacterium]|nr:acetyl-CoA carboxylase biotin carboxyl carrier protein [Clostridia bacterium]